MASHILDLEPWLKVDDVLGGHVRIGELSQRVGVPAATVRYYEKRGLLRKPPRTEAGYRSYPAEAALELRLIRWAKTVGFTLRELRDLLAVVTTGTRREQA